MGKCIEVETVIKRHCEIMDRYDPSRRIDLLLDEWGTWWNQEPGTIRGHLYQQNTLRDAMVAALSFNIFHKYTYRLKMTNIAQMINVLQSMILTRDDEIVLTPTYYIYSMYAPHQGAEYLPMHFESAKLRDRNNREVELLSATASRAEDGTITISLANVDVENECRVSIILDDDKKYGVKGSILSASTINAHNTFENPDVVKCEDFTSFISKKGSIEVVLPAKSIVSLTLK